jgi:hypothetical protein
MLDWALGSLCGPAGAILMLEASWWWYVPGIVVFYVVSFPIRGVLINLNLGKDAPPPKPGFKEFIRKAEGRDKE